MAPVPLVLTLDTEPLYSEVRRRLAAVRGNRDAFVRLCMAVRQDVRVELVVGAEEIVARLSLVDG
jgi:hypothetical protein